MHSLFAPSSGVTDTEYFNLDQSFASALYSLSGSSNHSVAPARARCARRVPLVGAVLDDIRGTTLGTQWRRQFHNRRFPRERFGNTLW